MYARWGETSEMLTIVELQDFLRDSHADFEILLHEMPIICMKDAAKYFDIKKASPVFIMDTGQSLLAFLASASSEKINFKEIGKSLGYSKFKLANAEKIQEITGYVVGAIPLIGHNLPCIFDKKLLEHDYIYGGTGDLYHTLKITPKDTMILNNVIHYVE